MMVGAGLFSMFLFLGLYLQVILGYSPLKTGFAFLPFSIGIIIFAGVASQLLPKVGPKPLIIWGLFQSTFGLFLLSFITPETSYVTHVLPSLIIMSTGMALVFIPISTTALHGIGGRDSGVASAALNTSQQVGGSLGTALLNTIAATSAANYLINNPGLGDKAQVFALTHGYTASFKAGAAMLIVAAIVMMVFIKVGKESLVEKE
jgi:predicted MFS family arabinose efflux permease